MKVGIIGGGLMGLSIAKYLSETGCSVTVFERDQQLGGLTTYQDYGKFFWDRFYHVILPSDTYLINFLQSIGLNEKLQWRRTLTGFYVDEKFHSVSSNLDFLRFPPLGLLEKFRLALTILYCSRVRNWQRLEQVLVEDWLVKTCGRRTYEKIWKPLLLAKLGECYKEVSAVFIWSNIKRMYSARASSAKKEHMGYIAGGYKSVFDRLALLIRSKAGQIVTQASVKRVSPDPDGGLWVEDAGGKEHFDKVIFTGPVSVLPHLVAEELAVVESRSGAIGYLGVVCMVILTKKPITPYYIVNIADERVPFTGVIGMSNLVSPEETAGLFLTYLPKYVRSNDPLLEWSDEDLRVAFLRGLKLMFPELNEEDIEGIYINRASKVQPLQVLGYSDMVPTVETRHKDFFIVNTAQFVSSTLNNNEVVRAVETFIKTYGPTFRNQS